MKSGVVLATLVAAAIVSQACGFQHSTSVTAPTAASSSAATGTPSGTTSSSTTPSIVGAWASTAALPTVSSSTTCGDFQFQIATQTATNILGSFTATCTGGIGLSGNASGALNGNSVAVTAIGTAALPGVSNCAFTLNGTGTIEDNGYTLRIPFSGTTCLGPVSGTEVLRRPQPAVQVSFAAPIPVSPGVNAFVSTLRPRFTVTNATRTGPVGAVSYQIEVAADGGFANIVASWTVAEQTSQTSFEMPKDLSYSKVYYWHVRASDPTTPGPWSVLQAFQVTDPPAPVPSAGGQDAIDLRSVTITGGSPADVGNWPATARLTALDFQSSGVAVSFTKKDGAGRWPDVVPPGWSGALQYTLWMVVNVDGHWYTSGGVEYWYGLGRSGGPPSQFASNWYYSPAVWGPLAGHQPAPGEMVGFFVTAGDARVKDVRSVTERSNVVLVPFPSDSGAYYPF
jgi:hypothetical protein